MKNMDSDSVNEFIKKELPDWDDEVIATARFKAFSGQRPDWEARYHFWRDLILKISRHFGVLTINPSQVKNVWFNRGGLTPLCIDHVLFLMYSEGDILRSGDLEDPSSGRLYQLFRRVRKLMVRSTMDPEITLEDRVIITLVLKEKAAEVVKLLSESHWTSSCIITMNKLKSICGGSDEASAVLSYLSGCRKAQHLSSNKKELIEGVKFSLSSAPVSSISSLDCDVLHLLWTIEKLHQQLDVIDQRYEMSRELALASLKSGNKKVALRHARELKMGSESREKCMSLLNRVEEVLNVIVDAESTKKVSEAIQIGAHAMKQNRISVEEVQHSLDEFEESVESHKQVEIALESSQLHSDIADEDIEEEFKRLELELDSENSQVQIPKTGISNAAKDTVDSESTELLSNALSSLRLGDSSVEPGSQKQNSAEPLKKHKSTNPVLEAA